jgi:DNA-binding XRE family transcriptional regulator
MAAQRALTEAQEEKIREARAAGKTQSELADKYGVCITTIRNIERR